MTVVEFWVEQYQTVVAEKKALGDKLRETLEENKDLQQKINRLEHSLTYTALKNMEANIEDLQTRLNNSRASNEAIRSMNSALSRRHASTMHQVQELKMQLEDKAEGYKKKLELHNTVTADLDAQLKSMTERLDKSIADRSELQADRDIWFRKNGEKQAEIEELKNKIQSLEADLEFKALCRDGWRDRAEKAERQLEEEKKHSYSNGYSDGNEEGQNELWEMLQMVKDMGPNEVDTEYECLGDVIDMDLEDFKEAYGKWEAEQKKVAEEAKKQHIEFMRGYLKRYCVGKVCFGCPLYNASEPVSSCLFSKLTDEEVEKRYRKVIESERKVRAADDPCNGVREKVKEACDAFAEGLKAGLASEVKEVPVSCDIPIKDLASWEYTIEGTVEINEDILKVVCGIKDDKK